MNLKTIVCYTNLISMCICLKLFGEPIISSAPQQDNAVTQDITSEAVINPRESQDADFSYFNDPYLMQQKTEEPFVDLLQQGIVQSPTEGENASNRAVVDRSESRDVDFTFFNDPYAFEKFNDLPIKAKFGGYLQYSSWWYSRQVVTAGEGYWFLFPQPKLYDVDCKDINARGDYNAGFLETRLRAEFYGPLVLGAESYAYIETDFFGSSVVANRLRIRHAFMKLTWKPSEILLGQYWNPIFEPKCYPLTLDFGAGTPNATFARNPQIRYRYAHNNKEFILVAAAQLDTVNTGPVGANSIYLRNSRIPMLYVRGGYENDQVYVGFCVGYERLVPRLESNTGYKVNESINSAVALMFAKVIFDPMEIRQSIIYGQNANNLLLLGGFGVSRFNPATGQREYTNISTLNYWIDINITRKTEPGIFIGIAKNLGARKNVIQCLVDPPTGDQESTVYGLGLDINTLLRVAPRVRWHVLPVDFCAEIEYVRASYGCLNNKAQVKNHDPVTGIRLLLTTYYYF